MKPAQWTASARALQTAGQRSEATALYPRLLPNPGLSRKAQEG